MQHFFIAKINKDNSPSLFSFLSTFTLDAANFNTAAAFSNKGFPHLHETTDFHPSLMDTNTFDSFDSFDSFKVFFSYVAIFEQTNFIQTGLQTLSLFLQIWICAQCITQKTVKCHDYFSLTFLSFLLIFSYTYNHWHSPNPRHLRTNTTIFGFWISRLKAKQHTFWLHQ